MSIDVDLAVECRGLEYRFGDKVALAGVNLDVGRGPVATVVPRINQHSAARQRCNGSRGG